MSTALFKKSALFKVLFVLATIVSGLSAFTPSARATECANIFGAPAPLKPKLIIFSAPSGGGKTTLAQMLIKDFSNLQISVSSTTRAPRGQEKDGVDYHFLTVDDFKKKIAAGDFAEHAEVHGNFYGTDASVIRNNFAQGKSVLALVDIAGAAKLRKAFPGEVYTIFISPPDLKILEARLRARGTETEAAIQTRLANAKSEMDAAKDFDRTIVNDDLQVAYDELKKVMASVIGQ